MDQTKEFSEVNTQILLSVAKNVMLAKLKNVFVAKLKRYNCQCCSVVFYAFYIL